MYDVQLADARSLMRVEVCVSRTGASLAYTTWGAVVAAPTRVSHQLVDRARVGSMPEPSVQRRSAF